MYDGVTMMMRGSKITNQLHLFLGLPARHRHDSAAQSFGAVVRAQAASKQAVTVGDMNQISGPATAGEDRSRHQLGPDIDVVARVRDDCRFAGGAARRMQPNRLLPRHRKQPERILIAKVLLHQERKRLRSSSARTIIADARRPLRMPVL